LPLPSHTPLPVEQLITDYLAGATQHQLARTHALRQTRIPQHRAATARRNRSGRLISEELNPDASGSASASSMPIAVAFPAPFGRVPPACPRSLRTPFRRRSECVFQLYYDS
jgi:hypothetical protein